MNGMILIWDFLKFSWRRKIDTFQETRVEYKDMRLVANLCWVKGEKWGSIRKQDWADVQIWAIHAYPIPWFFLYDKIIYIITKTWQNQTQWKLFWKTFKIPWRVWIANEEALQTQMKNKIRSDKVAVVLSGLYQLKGRSWEWFKSAASELETMIKESLLSEKGIWNEWMPV